MTIWVRLGVSVALAAIFGIVMSEFLQSTRYYELYRWYFCSGLAVVGVFLWLIGRKANAQHAQNLDQERISFGDNNPEEAVEDNQPFLLFNLAYWGAMLMVFGVISVFIVPRYSQTQGAASPQTVAARPTGFSSNAAPVKFPKVQMQGLVYHQDRSSVILDGQTYFVGEQVGGATIAKITPQGITLEMAGQSKVLNLERELLKNSMR